ncbi:MAG: hypothetical protein HY520_02015 [Candidatus Aenigmarchaeota archaeon]|nr:hypothetical protein [Candidatus Aenigmarchaeota archaeon]
MKAIHELIPPDRVQINGAWFQVVRTTSTWYHADRRELEMAIELAKVGDPRLFPRHRLTYVRERPGDLAFFSFDERSQAFRKQRLDAISW